MDLKVSCDHQEILFLVNHNEDIYFLKKNSDRSSSNPYVGSKVSCAHKDILFLITDNLSAEFLQLHE